MDFSQFFQFEDQTEQPLDKPAVNGGYCGILRTIGCVGDSLSSGEFESIDENGNRGYHDMFDYSWGQFIARDCGCRVYNFSRGGMTAKEYMESFAEANGFWDDDKVCKAYILALGVNDIINAHQPVGALADINPADWRKNNFESFAGCYAAIVQRLLEKQPKARLFFVTAPKNEHGSLMPEHTALLYQLTEIFPFSYVIDLDRYAPAHDGEFRRRFYMSGHMNPMGYRLTALQMESYIDYIIRQHPADFCQMGFVGGGIHNVEYKW